jgi:hypothetical protein
MILSIENLRTVERYLKMAHRVARAASYSSSGGLTPDQANGFNYKDPGLDITQVRALMAGASNAFDAAYEVLDYVTDYIQ